MEYKTTIHKRVKAKLHTSGGFTFAELMLTMLILALMTGMAAEGIPVVIRVYQREVDTANAETYLNTTMIALRGRLCVASEVTIGDKKVYLDPQIGYYQISNSDKGIQIEQYLGITIDTTNPQKTTQLLAPSEKSEFISSYNDEVGIQYDPKGFFTVKGLQVSKKGEVLAKLDDDFIIHTVNP